MIVDEKQWDTIIVEEGPPPPPTGQILTAFVRDDTTGEIYLSDDFPVSLPLGHLVRVHFSFRNTGGTPQNMKGTVQLIDPDGIIRDTMTSTQYVDPGWQKATPRTDPVELNKAGTWIIHALLEADSIVLDERQWDAIAVEVEVAGLYVFVHDTDDNPLAAVSATLNSHETASMLDGTFSFLDIEPGDYTLTCTKEGYKDRSKDISLVEGRNDEDIKMLREDEEESWWDKLETWMKAAIIGGGASIVIGLLALATREKGK